MSLRLALLLCLAGCVEWPQVGREQPRQSGPWPQLVPVAELFGTVPEARTDEADQLAAARGCIAGARQYIKAQRVVPSRYGGIARAHEAMSALPIANEAANRHLT